MTCACLSGTNPECPEHGIGEPISVYPDPTARLAAERARFELSRDWRDTGAAEKERHWQTWCAAMRIKR